MDVASLNIITKFLIGISGIIGLLFYKEILTVGISFYFPFFFKNVANTGAVEIGVALLKLVVPNKKTPTGGKKKTTARVKNKPATKNVVSNKPPVEKKPTVVRPMPDTVTSIPHVQPDMTVRLKQKQDSIMATGQAGPFQHEPLVLEKATLDFNFEFNSSDVNEKTALYLDDLARALKDNPELKIQLIGHTDNVGSEKFNLKLSYYRAQKMRDYLIRKGVESTRIATDGKGMQEPLNDNSTPEKRAVNRRVALIILY
jgi:outer membrane protein OmpA-like peptidoglycan-associated protein